jgi:hypothetical protein
MSQAARQSIEAETVQETAANAQADEPGEAQDKTMLARALDRAIEGIRRHPIPAVGGAFALGFVIGNGIPKFVGRTAVTIGLRALLRRVLEDSDIVESI